MGAICASQSPENTVLNRQEAVIFHTSILVTQHKLPSQEVAFDGRKLLPVAVQVVVALQQVPALPHLHRAPALLLPQHCG